MAAGVGQDGKGQIEPLRVLQDEVTGGEGDHCHGGLIAEPVECVAHGDDVLRARQSMDVSVKHHQDRSTPLVGEAPSPAVRRSQVDRGRGLSDLRAVRWRGVGSSHEVEIAGHPDDSDASASGVSRAG